MKKFLKRFAVIFVFTVIGALIVRAIISTDKTVFDDFAVTEASKSAYSANGELKVQTLDLKHIISTNGFFSAYSLYYVEETGELQVTVRYNNSALEYTDTTSHDDFSFMLLRRATPVDLTGENVSDDQEVNLFNNYDGEYYLPDSVETESRWGLYKYRKLIFKNIELTQIDELALVLAPKDAVIPTPDDDALIRKDAYDSYFDIQILHYSEQPYEDYKLSRSDKNDLTK